MTFLAASQVDYNDAGVCNETDKDIILNVGEINLTVYTVVILWLEGKIGFPSIVFPPGAPVHLTCLPDP